MPVINTTPTKTLAACDASQGAFFNTNIVGCDLVISNGSPVTGVTNIEYVIKLGATTLQTINTTSTIYYWEPASLYSEETITITQTITSGLGTFEYTADVGLPDMSSCYFAFSSNTGAADTFDPAITNSSTQNVYWRMPDDVVRSGASQTVTGSSAGFDGTTQEVRVRPISFSLVSQINVPSDKVIGFIDFTQFTAATTINFSANPGITGFSVIGLSSLVNLYMQDCTITGAIDISDCTSLSIFHIYNNVGVSSVDIPVTTWTSFHTYNTAIQNITFPVSTVFSNVSISVGDTIALTVLDFSNVSGTAIFLNAEDSSITSLDTTTFDFSTNAADNCQIDVGNCTSLATINHTGNVGNLQNYVANNTAIGSLTVPFDFNSSSASRTIFIANCSNLTILTFTGSGTLKNFRCYSNDISGTQDASMFNFVTNCSFWMYDNPTLTSINHGSGNTGTFSSYQVFTCSLGYYSLGGNTLTSNVDFDAYTNAMTAAEVNQWLVNLDNGGGGEALLPSSGTGSIDLAGSNVAPDGTSGGFDGTTAKANIIADGYSVTTN